MVNVCITKCNLVSSHWPFHPYVLILYSFLQLYLFDLSTIACLKFPSGCEITGWPRRFIPVVLGAYQSARINFDILTFTYDYVYNFNLYFARASEGIHLHVLCISHLKFWWKNLMEDQPWYSKENRKINCNRIISWSAHTSEVHHHRKKSVCTSTNAVWKKENKVNLIWNCKVLYLLYSLTI